MKLKPKTRIYVESPLGEGAHIALPESAAHQLLHALRAKAGDTVLLFNGADGEWLAEIAQAGKRDLKARVLRRTAAQQNAPDIWLAFAPVKNEKIDYTVKRAVELGVSRLLPVMTRHTVVGRVNTGRLRANAVEAAEQSGRHDVPEVAEPQALERLLGGWQAGRALFFCDESGQAPPLKTLLLRLISGPCAVLIGPEGGFAREEQTLLRTLPFVAPLHMGPRILRAETAALAALANIQAWLGDWDTPPKGMA
jgi:16S rRNA (uracil1498-N3)-methyltransferase